MTETAREAKGGWEYVCDHARRRIRVRLGPDATSEDFMRSIDRQVADEGWAYGTLYDLRARTPGHAQGAIRVTHYLAAYARALGARGPVAIVTGDVSGTHRVITRGKELGFQTKVFSDPASAECWLEQATSSSPEARHENGGTRVRAHALADLSDDGPEPPQASAPDQQHCAECGGVVQAASRNDQGLDDWMPVWRCVRCGAEVPR